MTTLVNGLFKRSKFVQMDERIGRIGGAVVEKHEIKSTDVHNKIPELARLKMPDPGRAARGRL